MEMFFWFIMLMIGILHYVVLENKNPKIREKCKELGKQALKMSIIFYVIITTFLIIFFVSLFSALAHRTIPYWIIIIFNVTLIIFVIYIIYLFINFVRKIIKIVEKKKKSNKKRLTKHKK